jgi:hypothetical protein
MEQQAFQLKGVLDTNSPVKTGLYEVWKAPIVQGEKGLDRTTRHFDSSAMRFGSSHSS